MNSKEMEQPKKAWVELIKSLFPAHAEINTHNRSNDYYIDIQWYLRNDPDRPNKLSREIKIQITRAAMKDYLEFGSKQRSEWDMKFKKHVEEKLDKFNPEHDSHSGQTPPEEIWTITSSIFN